MEQNQNKPIICMIAVSPTPTTSQPESAARWSPDGKWFGARSSGPSYQTTPAMPSEPDLGSGLDTECSSAGSQRRPVMRWQFRETTQGIFVQQARCVPGAGIVGGHVMYPNDRHGKYSIGAFYAGRETKIYRKCILMGTGNAPEVERINGTLRWATITLPGSGAPTLSNVTETDASKPLGDAAPVVLTIGTKARARCLLSVESQTCTIFIATRCKQRRWTTESHRSTEIQYLVPKPMRG